MFVHDAGDENEPTNDEARCSNRVLVKLIEWVCLQGCGFVEVESAENFSWGWFAIYHKVSLGVCRLFGLLN
jgi:hypothetical protein